MEGSFRFSSFFLLVLAFAPHTFVFIFLYSFEGVLCVMWVVIFYLLFPLISLHRCKSGTHLHIKQLLL